MNGLDELRARIAGCVDMARIVENAGLRVPLIPAYIAGLRAAEAVVSAAPPHDGTYPAPAEADTAWAASIVQATKAADVAATDYFAAAEAAPEPQPASVPVFAAGGPARVEPRKAKAPPHAPNRGDAPGRPVTVWTPQRLALARTNYARGDTLEAIRLAVNELPGLRKVMTPKAVHALAAKHGWKRPAKVEPTPVAATPTPKADAAPKPAAAEEPLSPTETAAAMSDIRTGQAGEAEAREAWLSEEYGCSVETARLLCALVDGEAKAEAA